MNNINREETSWGGMEGGYQSNRYKSSTPDYTAEQQSEQDTHTHKIRPTSKCGSNLWLN